MEAKLRWLSIVILAENHNPGIPSKDWLARKNIFKEEAKNFANTPIFSLFESENFRLTVDQKRLEMVLVRPSEDGIDDLVDAALKYVNALPETPYKGLGNNIHWQISYTSKEERNRMLADIFIKPENPFWKSILKYAPKVGGVIYWKFKSFAVKLTMEPREEALVILNFNYHYDIQDFKDLLKNFKKFRQCYLDSNQIKENIVRLGE